MEKYNVSEKRLRQRENLLKAGINPYLSKGSRTKYISEVLVNLDDGKSECIAGRIKEKNGCMISIEDITGSIEVRVEKTQDTNGNIKFENIDIGDFISLTGNSKMDNVIYTKDYQIDIITKTLIDPPDTETWEHDTEQHWEKRYVDLSQRKSSVEVFKSRVRMIKAIRRFLDDKGMSEVETPILRSWYDLVCYEQFEVKNQDNQSLYLRVCHEDKLKLLISGGFEKVYELGKSFRPSDFSWKHSVEFTQLETIQAYTDYHDMMEHAEQLYAYVTKETIGKLTFRSKNGEIIDLTPPWKRISVRDAILQYSGIDIYEQNTAELLKSAILSKVGLEKVNEYEKVDAAFAPGDSVNGKNVLPPKPYSEWFWGLVEHCLDYFVTPHIVQPTIFFDYPLDSNWLCKRKNERKDYIERFEAYIDGIEICNCYTLVNDPVDFVERMEEQRDWYFKEFGKEDYPLDKNLILAKCYGLPPMSESSFGIDRWLMLITEQEHLQDVIWLPYPYV